MTRTVYVITTTNPHERMHPAADPKGCVVKTSYTRSRDAIRELRNIHPEWHPTLTVK